MDCSATKNKQAGPWKHDFYGLITDNGLSFVGHWAHRSSRDPGEVFFNSFDGRINEASKAASAGSKNPLQEGQCVQLKRLLAQA